MTWATLAAVRASVLEFSEASGLREAHHFVRVLSGRWSRTLGPPANATDSIGRTLTARNVRGNVWHMEIT